MSLTLPAGIDFGNLHTLASVFEINEKEPIQSTTVIVADRNGNKEPSSQVYFENGKRLSGTAAAVCSDHFPNNCVQFIKSSIKRDFATMSDRILKIVKCMKSDENGKVEFVLNINGEEKHFWPSQLAGSYIADRIEDIKTERKTSDLSLVISVPSYFTDEQIAEFEAGLVVSQITDYVLIREADAIAIEYGYMKNLHNEFETPVTVLFVGVGFSEAQGFVVEYSKDKYELLCYEHTNAISSSHVDDIMNSMSCSEFNEAADPEYDGEIDENGDAFFHMFNTLARAKEQFSNSDNETVEITLQNYDKEGNEFSLDLSAEQLNSCIDESGMLQPLQEMIQRCIDKCNKSLSALEICDDGIRTLRFRETVDSVLQANGIHLEMNTRRLVHESVARGNALYAFYKSYINNPAYEGVISKLCSSVCPINNSNGFSSTLMTRISEAQEMKGELDELEKVAKRRSKLQNQLMKMITDYQQTVDKGPNISGIGDNEYYLNAVMVIGILDKYRQKYDTVTKDPETPIDTYEELVKGLESEMKTEMERFHIQHEIELENERIRKAAEEAERRRREEEERRRREEEEKRKLKETVERWTALKERECDLTYHFTEEELTFLKTNELIVEQELMKQEREGQKDFREFQDRSFREFQDRDFRNHKEKKSLRFSGLLGLRRSKHDDDDDDDVIMGIPTRKKSSIPENLEQLNKGAAKVPITRPPVPAPTFDLNKISNECTIELENGLYYTGTLFCGIPNGLGSLWNAYQNELIYRGHFSNGYYHGYGVKYRNNKIECSGRFENGFFKEGQFISVSGAIQVGTFNKEGNLDGEGRLILPSGGYLIGQWKNGKPVGPFTIFMGAGREPMTYDFSKKDENTKFNVTIHNDFIFYDDRYLLSAGDVFLYYFNGDIFIGTVSSTNKPLDGYYFRLVNGCYYELKLGTGLRGCEIAFDYSPYCSIKNCIIRVKKSVSLRSSTHDTSGVDEIPFDDYKFEDYQHLYLQKS